MMMRIAAAAVTCFAALGTMASPAQADSGDTAVGGVTVSPFAGENGCVSTTGAKACFFHYGDRIVVEDTRGDGLRSVAEFRFSYDRAPGECHNAGGEGSSRECNYNMWEQGQVSIRAVTRNGASGQNVNESPWSEWFNIG
ncbi:hypothetical protein [Streptomyces yaizuensis]|uniref:Secreted protein n=1 Tax=Streptomyces yaizuensis TaxID=2989713 RepID=A0ABQ5P8E0_9ACTN|nr:hypothetical protein [Streptomyces sp. YSPA8]GLF98853.1 hypothetical protein SYYSPA8_31170 [Streptomyces sp. YSPA8]